MKRKSIKTFETIIIWLLLFYLVLNILFFFKLYSSQNLFNDNIGWNNNLDIIYGTLRRFTYEFKSFQEVVLIYRLVTVGLAVVILTFIIYRIIMHEAFNILKFNNVILISIVIYSLILNYILVIISKSLFYLIDENTIGKDIFFQNLQNIVSVKWFILLLFLVITILLVVGIIVNIYEVLSLTDTVRTKYLNIVLLIISIIIASVSFSYIYNVDSGKLKHIVNIHRSIIQEFSIKDGKVDYEYKIYLKPNNYKILNKDIRNYLNYTPISTLYDDYITNKNYIIFNAGRTHKIENVTKASKKDIFLINLNKLYRLILRYDEKLLKPKKSYEDSFYVQKDTNNIFYLYKINNDVLQYVLKKDDLDLLKNSYVIIDLKDIYIQGQNDVVYYSNLKSQEIQYISENQLNEYLQKNNLEKLGR